MAPGKLSAACGSSVIASEAASLAAVALGGLTAWQMLVDVAGVGPQSKVVVNGAAGGVGHLAVQIAKLLGAFVIAVARSEKRELVERLGADRVID